MEMNPQMKMKILSLIFANIFSDDFMIKNLFIVITISMIESNKCSEYPKYPFIHMLNNIEPYVSNEAQSMHESYGMKTKIASKSISINDFVIK